MTTSAPGSVKACPSCGTKNRVPVAASGLPRCGSCHKDLPWLVDASDVTFNDAVRTKAVVIVDLWAPWCGPCRMVAPILEEFSVELAGRLKVVKVNVDSSPATANRYRATSIPMMLIMIDGEVVDTIVGAAPKASIRSHIDAALLQREVI